MRFRFAAILGALVLLAAACTSTLGDPPEPGEARTSPPPPPKVGYLARVACSIPNAHELLLRTWRGYRADRSGQLQFIPVERYFIDGGINHSGPWNYLQRVPLLLYGPGHVEPAGRVVRQVTLADLAPTYAELLDFRFPRRDGTVLHEALVPESNRPDPPRLIVTLVWDGGGRNVIDFHEEEHPFLTSLIEEGTWYERAEVGSAPSATGPVHPVMSTGAFPRKHGLVGNHLFLDDKGTIGDPWTYGPRLLLLPTLADLYDKALDNEPLVGLVGTSPWYLGMIGRGALEPGGDRDTVVLRTAIGDEGAEGNYWNLPGMNRPFYDLAEYVNGLTKLREFFPVADAADGAIDGLWRGHDILGLDGGFDSPARLPYQSEVIHEVIEREGFGQDGVPDLFYTNYKLIDEIGHRWYFSSEEMGDTIREQDHQLEELVEFLDDRVGRGNYVLALTADHGHTPDPRVAGGFRISLPAVKNGIADTFDDDGDDVKLLLAAKPTHLFLNPLEMENEEELENGLTLSQMARYLLSLTKEEVAFTEATPTGPPNVPTGQARDDPVIAAAFPSHMFDDLPCLPEARAG